MWKRMFKPGMVVFSAALTLVSMGLSHFLVYVLGWRYEGWSGFKWMTFDASFSFAVYTIYSGLLLPPAWFVMYLFVYTTRRKISKSV